MSYADEWGAMLKQPYGGGQPVLPQALFFAGDYEVVGPDPALGHHEVAELGANMILIHYHHRHEYAGGSNKGLWGTLAKEEGGVQWEELDRVVESARQHFSIVGLYPIGWAHMVPQRLGETVLDIDPEVVSDWVAEVVDRYHDKVDIFPIFYELNVFDLFFRSTHLQPYGDKQKAHIVSCLVLSARKVLARTGIKARDKLVAATFVELTNSSFYWMSEGKLLELPRGSALLHAPLCPNDLIKTARQLDGGTFPGEYQETVRRLLARLIFWNADDSGANDTVGDDLYRIYQSGMFFESHSNPEGYVRQVIAGWDAQPQNTYEYLLKRMVPNLSVPTPAECLKHNFDEMSVFLGDGTIPWEVRNSVVGFVLDDIFKCTKQSGITSAIYPSETIDSSGMRHGGRPLRVSDIGAVYAEIIRATRHKQEAGVTSN